MLSALVCLALAAAAPAPDTVVVCPEPFREAIAPWIELRKRQGHNCLVIGSDSAEAIRERIRVAAAAGSLKYIQLVGDAPLERSLARLTSTVPTHYAPSQVIQRFGGEKSIAGDNWYADLDDDRLPDVAVGRLTADSPAELTTIVRKIVAYETRPAPGAWQRRVSLVAGLGGFGAIADAAIEACAKRLLVEGIPAAYATTVTYGSWRSPYCPDPRAFHAATLERFNEGCLFWVYMGHGQTQMVDRVRAPDGPHHVLAVGDCAMLRCGERAPIALLLCCSAGGFDQRDDCLAEEFLRSREGPVAAIAGSRVTMPYAMSVLGAELLRIYFQERPATVGELLLAAKRAMILRPRDDPHSRAIDALSQLLNPASADLAAERVEHLELFNLLGDPLLRLPRPREAKLEAPQQAAAGATIEISGTSPLDGDAEIELVVRRDRLTFRPAPRGEYQTSPEARDEFQATYAKANNTVLAARSVRISAGPFRMQFAVPATASGPCHVRLFVQGAEDAAVGSADVTIEPAAVKADSNPPDKPGG
jgi:hypothetical protein